jgi:NhaP-type Na+/H+ or K+/H+ antiporter
LGILSALFLELFWGISVEFNEAMFFSIILPPIIFSQGYNLRKKYFFENFGIICYYGLLGKINKIF